MRTRILMMVALLFSGFSLTAQHGQGKGGMHLSQEEKEAKREKVAEMKVEYITMKLELTSLEAEKFWPVYNEMVAKMHELEMKGRSKRGEKPAQEMSDEEILERINIKFEIAQSVLDMKLEYNKRFLEVLPVNKVGKLYQAERSFRHEVLRKMKSEGHPRE